MKTLDKTKCAKTENAVESDLLACYFLISFDVSIFCIIFAPETSRAV